MVLSEISQEIANRIDTKANIVKFVKQVSAFKIIIEYDNLLNFPMKLLPEFNNLSCKFTKKCI